MDYQNGITVCVGNWGYHSEGYLHDARIMLPKTVEDFLKPSGTCELEYEGLFLPKKEYGIDQLMADLSDETPETGEDGPGGR